MTVDLLMLLCAISAGATVQAGVGIGFSIIVAPVMMVMLGTAVAVPFLLLLNLLVSIAATDPAVWRSDKRLIRNSAVGCLIGIVLGLFIYPLLSERVVLALTALLLLIGVVTSMLPVGRIIGRSGFHVASGLSGLATVWAATPGPLMVLGFLALGRSGRETRKLVQPVALAAYGAAFVLHVTTDASGIARAPWLWECAVAAICGGLLGRAFGSKLPEAAISQAIRVISVIACIILFRRAFMVGG